jgi:Fe2+ transport system protein FeoA
LIQRINDGFEGGTFLAQRLCALGFVPDVRLLQLGVYLFETFFLRIIVKDTP